MNSLCLFCSLSAPSNGCMADMVMFHTIPLHTTIVRLNNGYVSFVRFVCIHAFLCHRSCTRAHLFADLIAWYGKYVAKRKKIDERRNRWKSEWKSRFAKDEKMNSKKIEYVRDVCVCVCAAVEEMFHPHQCECVEPNPNIGVSERISHSSEVFTVRNNSVT